MWGRVPEERGSAPAVCWCSWQANPFRADVGGAFCEGEQRKGVGQCACGLLVLLAG